MEKERSLPSPIAEDDDEEARGSDADVGFGDDDVVGEQEDSVVHVRQQERTIRLSCFT